MPAMLTYPDVYIEEIPSDICTITGVEKAVTAFLGRASLEPTNKPTTIRSVGNFERQFCGQFYLASAGDLPQSTRKSYD
jgi:hypothetical protein